MALVLGSMISDSATYRCPGCVNPANSATPQVLASQILGGVDQATLRSTLTCVNDDHGYPLDSEVWVYSNNLFQLEAAQVSILKATDIQVCVCAFMWVWVCTHVIHTLLVFLRTSL